MLPCTVWHTVAAMHHTKTIKPSVEISSLPPADVPAPIDYDRSEDDEGKEVGDNGEEEE